MIEPVWIIGLLVTILIAVVTMNGLLWASQSRINRRLGQLEGKLQHSCPFGTCPVFERALKEAAPERTNKEET